MIEDDPCPTEEPPCCGGAEDKRNNRLDEQQNEAQSGNCPMFRCFGHGHRQVHCKGLRPKRREPLH